MTPNQALNLLQVAANEYKGTLKDHQNLQTAVQTLRATIPKEETSNDKSPASKERPERTRKATK